MNSNQNELDIDEEWNSFLDKLRLSENEEVSPKKQYEIFCAFTLC